MKTLKTQPQTVFNNLFNAIVKEKKQRFNEFKAELEPLTKVDEILNKWRFNDLLSITKRKQNWELANLKAYLLEQRAKQDQKSIDKSLLRLQTIEKAPDLVRFDISMEWKKSKMWGSNPRAEGSELTESGYNKFDSGSVGGCGYDKGSTAVANVLNQSNSILKLLYIIKNKPANIKKQNRDLFGYGSGYGILPNIEGGVGVSCYPAIFKKLGYAFKTVASGKMFDVYQISK